MKTTRLRSTVSWMAFVFGWIVLSSSRTVAQQPETPELRQELAKLAATADLLEHSLPSFACQEEVVSEMLAGKKVKEHVVFTAEVRTRRDSDGLLNETFTMQTLNGKPVVWRKSSKGNYVRFNLPVYIKGGFDHAMSYFSSPRQECYRFSLAAGRIDFETAPDVASHSRCRDDQVHGFALLDAQGDAVHIERRVSAEAAEKFHLASNAVIDLAPVALGGRTFWLSRRLTAEEAVGPRAARFQAAYTGCHLFAATVTIGPATEVEPGDGSLTPHP